MSQEYLCIAVRHTPPLSVCIEGTPLLPAQWVRQLKAPAELVHSTPSPNAQLLARHVNEDLARGYVHDGFGFIGLDPEAALQRMQLVIGALAAAPEAAPTAVQSDAEPLSSEAAQEQYERAMEYALGSPRTIVSEERAFALFLDLAQSGFAMAYSNVATAYALGQGVEADLQTALDWAHRAIDAGQLAGYAAAARAFLLAGDGEHANEIWQQCFEDVHLPFVDREPETFSLLYTYAHMCLSGSIRECHSVDARSAFAATVKFYDQHGLSRDPNVAKAVNWLRERTL